MSSNPIFGYQASQDLDSDSWGNLVLAVTDQRVVSVDQFLAVATTWEEEFKQEANTKAMPSAWRSAKSVIKSAFVQDIPLVYEDENGKPEPRGKTAVEQAIKASKEAAKPEKDPQEKLEGLLKTAYQYAEKHGLSFSDTVMSVLSN